MGRAGADFDVGLDLAKGRPRNELGLSAWLVVVAVLRNQSPVTATPR